MENSKGPYIETKGSEIKFNNDINAADYNIGNGQNLYGRENLNNCGGINFKNNKTKTKLRMLFKSIAFIVVASVSGGATASYLIDKKLDKMESEYYFNYDEYVADERLLVSNNTLPKNSVTRVAELVGPAVVGISNSEETFSGKSVSNFTGSGIIFDPNGYIITNYHVIDGAERIMVKLASENTKPFEAKLIGSDKVSDLAIIKIDAKGLIYARFGDSSKVRVGDTAIAIGNPLGQEFAGSVTAGIISATNRRIEIADGVTGEKSIYKLLQTDAAINPGSSGGPLCNEAGQVIGITSLNIKQYAEGMGFAICINEVKKFINAIRDEGEVKRPYFGIEGGTANPDGNKGTYGVYVISVDSNYGAAEAGINPMDIITDIGDKKITNYGEFLNIIESAKVGDKLRCKIWRDGKTFEVEVTLKQKK